MKLHAQRHPTADLVQRYLKEQQGACRTNVLSPLEQSLKGHGRAGAAAVIQAVRRARDAESPVLVRMVTHLAWPQLVEALREAATAEGRAGETVRKLLEECGLTAEGPRQRAARLLKAGEIGVRCDPETADAAVHLLRGMPRASAERWLDILTDHPDPAIQKAAFAALERWRGSVSSWTVHGPLTGEVRVVGLAGSGALSLAIIAPHLKFGFTVARLVIDDDDLEQCEITSHSADSLQRVLRWRSVEWPKDYVAWRVRNATLVGVDEDQRQQALSLLSEVAGDIPHPAWQLPAHRTVLVEAMVNLIHREDLWSFEDVILELESSVENDVDATKVIALDGEDEEANHLLSLRLLDLAWSLQLHDDGPIALQAARLLRDDPAPRDQHPLWIGLAAHELESFDDDDYEDTSGATGDIDWAAATHGVPTEPVPSVRSTSDLEDTVDDFVGSLENGWYLTWEAVIREEQGLALAPWHRKALDELFSFHESSCDRVEYINEIARPAEAWYTTFQAIAAQLKVSRYVTASSHHAVTTEGWPRLVEALEMHGEHLSLPAGVSRHLDVIPEPLQHVLWMQSSFDSLAGLGQFPELNLHDQPYRLEAFHKALLDIEESVLALKWKVRDLLRAVIFPEDDQRRFVQWFTALTGRDESAPLSCLLDVSPTAASDGVLAAVGGLWQDG
ncbi:MAG: hypothetical protein ACYCW6_25410 [Candidatus Xenobia bacterium]